MTPPRVESKYQKLGLGIDVMALDRIISPHGKSNNRSNNLLTARCVKKRNPQNDKTKSNAILVRPIVCNNKSDNKAPGTPMKFRIGSELAVFNDMSDALYVKRAVAIRKTIESITIPIISLIRLLKNNDILIGKPNGLCLSAEAILFSSPEQKDQDKYRVFINRFSPDSVVCASLTRANRK